MSVRARISRLFARFLSGAPEASPAPRSRLTAERWVRIQDVLVRALERPPEERSAFLAEACGRDEELRGDAESLLAAHATPGPLDRLGEALRDTSGGDLKAGTEIGHFRLQGKLGHGGMGVVYRAHDTRLDRTVALKFLPSHLSWDDVAKQRFLLEAQAAAALDHPNICTIHEIGEAEDGRIYITMPYYGGESLDVRLAQGPLPLGTALDIAVQTARGLKKAHERGVVHRDIKPANLIVTDEGVAKILDFGIAKVADVHLTAGGLIVGTPHYMSPEQAAGGRVDRRSDLWSLGVVLYQMIVGRRPFDGPRFEAVLSAILIEEPEPPAAGVPGAAAVNRVVARLVAKDPEERYPSAGALIAALEDALVMVRGASGEQDSADAAAPRATAELAPGGERRQVAVVAAQIAGYAALVERLAPGELQGAVAECRAIAEEVVRGHGGVVNQVTNDRLVCLFGVPTTHENDCLRAVDAALGICARLRQTPRAVRIEVQVGISAGVIVAQPALRDDRPYAVAGKPLDLAATLAAHASPGEILLSPECERLVAGFFETQSGSALMLPERAEPLAPLRVLRPSGATTRLEAATRAELTPFVGREREREILESRLRDAVGGEGRFVTIVGEAGVGKSRLLHEFQQGLDGRPLTCVRGRCRSEGGLPYHPLVEVVRDVLDLGPEAAPTADPAEIASRVAGIAPELAPFTPLYLHLLSTPSERYPLPRHLKGEHFRPAIREALAALFTARAAGRPLVMLFEDWHWADIASHEALEEVAELVPHHPLMVIVTYRPGHGVRWSDALSLVAIQLTPLDAEASTRLIGSVLGADYVPDAVSRGLHERAGGNPFFLEELCHALIEEGTLTVADRRASLTGSLDALHLPATVHGVIRTRLDRLDADTRDIVRVAAVIGREFSVPVLERAVGAHTPLTPMLARLKELALVAHARVVPEPTYRFKHALTQEVAYDTLLQHQRRALHATVGTAIENLSAERIGENAEVLARHFSRAEDWRKAVRYGRQAAEQARRLSEFARAQELLERVEACALKLPNASEQHETLGDVLLQQEQLCETLGRRGRQREILRRLLELLEPAADRNRLAEVYRRQGDLYTLLGQFDQAETVLQRALALTRALGDPGGTRTTLTSLGFMCWHGDRSREALAYMEQALAISRERGDADEIAQGLHNLGAILRDLGEYERALAVLEEALEIAEAAGNPIATAYLLSNMANAYRLMGDRERSLQCLERCHGVQQSATTPDRLVVATPFILTSIAHLYLEHGRIDESLSAYGEAVEISRRTRNADALSQSLRIFGEVLLGLDREQEALPHLLEAANIFAQLENPESEGAMWAKVARIHERSGRPNEAGNAWETLRGLARSLGKPRLELEALEGRARAVRDGGQLAVASAAYQDVLEFVVRHFRDEPNKEAELCNALGILEWRRGAYGEALAHYERALARFQQTGSGPGIGLALNSLGATLAKLGREREARTRIEEAIAFNRQAGQRQFEGHALSVLGDLHYDSGRFAQATRCYRESLQIRRAIGDRRGEGWMLERLARAAGADGSGEADGEQLLDEARRIAAQLNDEELMRASGPPAAQA